jgi:hypothetical protein
MSLNYDLASEGGAKIYGDGGEDSVGVLHVKTAGAVPGVHVSRSAAGSQTIGILTLGGTSMASGAVMEFKGGFISLTSVLLTSAAHIDYAIPVQVGLETRYIPVYKASGLVGGATF